MSAMIHKIFDKWPNISGPNIIHVLNQLGYKTEPRINTHAIITKVRRKRNGK